MNRLIAPLLAAVCALAFAVPAWAVDCSDVAYTHNTTGTTINGVIEVLKDICENTAGGGGGGGDASAANQASQLAVEQAIRDRIGEVQGSPTSNTLLDRVKTLHTDLQALEALLPASLGAKSAANSLSITPATNALFSTQADGAPDAATHSDSVSSATTGYSFSTAGYASVTFQVTANASANTWVVEGSNDNSTWVTVPARKISDQAATPMSNYYGASGTVIASGILVPNLVLPYMRWRVGNYIGGSTAVTVGLKRSGSLGTVEVYSKMQTDSTTPGSNNGVTLLPANPGVTIANLSSVATTAVAGSISKASASNVFRWHVVAGASAGFVMVFNATSAPADGAVTPLECHPVAANGEVERNYGAIGSTYLTGFTLVFSTTGCFSKTVSATAFMSYQAK